MRQGVSCLICEFNSRIPTPGMSEYDELPPATQKAPKALIVVPTRELCLQVANDLEQAAESGLLQELAGS